MSINSDMSIRIQEVLDIWHNSETWSLTDFGCSSAINGNSNWWWYYVHCPQRGLSPQTLMACNRDKWAWLHIQWNLSITSTLGPHFLACNTKVFLSEKQHWMYWGRTTGLSVVNHQWWPVAKKSTPPIFVPPGPKISKYFDPRNKIVWNNWTPLKYFNPPTKFIKY